MGERVDILLTTATKCYFFDLFTKHCIYKRWHTRAQRDEAQAKSETGRRSYTAKAIYITLCKQEHKAKALVRLDRSLLVAFMSALVQQPTNQGARGRSEAGTKHDHPVLSGQERGTRQELGLKGERRKTPTHHQQKPKRAQNRSTIREITARRLKKVYKQHVAEFLFHREWNNFHRNTFPHLILTHHSFCIVWTRGRFVFKSLFFLYLEILTFLK